MKNKHEPDDDPFTRGYYGNRLSRGEQLPNTPEHQAFMQSVVALMLDMIKRT